jgi:hypothetical protein
LAADRIFSNPGQRYVYIKETVDFSLCAMEAIQHINHEKETKLQIGQEFILVDQLLLIFSNYKDNI